MGEAEDLEEVEAPVVSEGQKLKKATAFGARGTTEFEPISVSLLGNIHSIHNKTELSIESFQSMPILPTAKQCGC